MSRPTFQQHLQREQERQRRQREGGQHTDLSTRMDAYDDATRLKFKREGLRTPSPATIHNEGATDLSPTGLSSPELRMLNGLLVGLDDDQPEQLTQPTLPPLPPSSTSVGAGRSRDTSAFTTTEEEQRMYAPLSVTSPPQSPTSVGVGSRTPSDDPLATAGPSTSQDLGSYLHDLRMTANRRLSPRPRRPSPGGPPGGSPGGEGEGDDDDDNGRHHAEMQRTLERLREDENQRLQ